VRITRITRIKEKRKYKNLPQRYKIDFGMKFKIQNSKFKIVIVGAGPSGASLAIRLAKLDFDVTLIEREKFPRRKLCGEFISPECLRHFQDLGVLNEMLGIGDRILETVFYEPNGKSVSIPSKWFGSDSDGALSLSRAAMDFCLLEKTKKVGVEVLQETQAAGILFENDKICGVKIKSKNGETKEIFADLTIDATGRASVLSKLAERELSRIASTHFQSPKSKVQRPTYEKQNQNPKSKIHNRLVGFKTHLQNVNLEKGVCEIYFFRGGYGGLSFVENGLANHCFLIKAEIVKEFNSDAERIVREVIFKNKRAYQALKNAQPVEDWLAVSVEGFGEKELNPAKNLFAVGDAGAFIDPFTGSGMLMAFESAEILAKVIAENRFAPERIAENYKILHHRKFQKRMLVCSLLRRAALVPALAKSAISALSFSARLRMILARSTRETFSVGGK
jgi:flavin-dependent dehydrogenase